jgi:cytochrome b involved in lipid metabolism
VDGRVYDITEHIATHPGWSSGCRVTEVLSILAHLGCDCSAEFHDIHASYPVAYKQLAAYDIGPLLQRPASEASAPPQQLLQQRC